MALQKSTEVNGGICDGTCAAANARTHAGVDAGTSPTGTAEKRIKALLTYPPGAVGKPITYSLVRQFDLWINILHAEIAADKAGRLIMDILGDASNVDRGLAFLEEEGIEYEILNGSALWTRTGACTAVHAQPSVLHTLSPSIRTIGASRLTGKSATFAGSAHAHALLEP